MAPVGEVAPDEGEAVTGLVQPAVARANATTTTALLGIFMRVP